MFSFLRTFWHRLFPSTAITEQPRLHGSESDAPAPTGTGSCTDCGKTFSFGEHTVTFKRRPLTVTARPGITKCPQCLEAFINRFAARCGACHEPIFPGFNVGKAKRSGDNKAILLHMYMDCNPFGGMTWCGVWGEGRLVTPHELDPVQFPNKGDLTPYATAVMSGEAVIVNFK